MLVIPGPVFRLCFSARKVQGGMLESQWLVGGASGNLWEHKSSGPSLVSEKLQDTDRFQAAIPHGEGKQQVLHPRVGMRVK